FNGGAVGYRLSAIGEEDWAAAVVRLRVRTGRGYYMYCVLAVANGEKNSGAVVEGNMKRVLFMGVLWVGLFGGFGVGRGVRGGAGERGWKGRLRGGVDGWHHGCRGLVGRWSLRLWTSSVRRCIRRWRSIWRIF